MPELPEVVTVIKALTDEKIIGAKFKTVNVIVNKVLKNSTPKSINTFLSDERVTKIDHKGKYIVLTLTHGKILVIHLRLEGKIFIEHSNQEVRKYLCVEFIMNSFSLRLYDSRKFATVHIFKNQNEYKKSSIIKNIALDPLQKDFTFKYLQNHLKNTNVYIKTALLDQTNVSGIGNIYADEILFDTKISPLRRTQKVTKQDLLNIINSSKKILKASIKAGGSTISTFESSNGHIGSYQNKLKIHGKKICPICKKKTIFTKVNGRGTTYCKYCQK
jgi:formamidopyrimidine-DNA glycosylase